MDKAGPKVYKSYLLSRPVSPGTGTSEVYIVYLGLNRIVDPILTTKFHTQLLSNVFSSREEARQSKLYSYKHSFSGFSAKMNSTQAATLASNMKGVIAVFKSRIMRPHTTRSWDFMGLTVDNSEVTPLQLTYGDDIIVGVLDSGVWPESESFHEEPCLGPIPSSWKGKCVKGEDFDPIKACNRKLIGARYYLRGFEAKFGPLNANGKSEYLSARDFYGHGTHTASTAVGSIVKNVSFLGFGLGTARGGAPRARLSVYKVCWTENYHMVCDEADVLKGFDDALHDGVHVISVSFGVTPPLAPFVNWTADIGSFHAMQMGVSVVFSAGNDGPVPSLVQNVAPWATSVAASSIDRTFPTEILVNDDLLIMYKLSGFSEVKGAPRTRGKWILTGEGFITSRINAKLSGARAFFQDGICHPDNWNKSKKASGKVILCFSTRGQITSDTAEKAAVLANASGLIFVEPLFNQIADVDIIPTVRIDIVEGTKLNNLLGEAYW
ncbi:Peptidase S8/S53 domain [Dillenia turbinata]|uniref:Peptidase S8/S53 domain n=1 Tax=Dillenia turbinata TaxID=194707 RepID=A0AAN8VMQ4_9MAGN